VSRWPNKYVIGLTGNIAVGKSVVRQMLQHLGAYTVDADGLVHQAMSPGAPAYQPVVEMFGRFILDDNKEVNRAMLGSIAFTFPDALAKLEAITHPVVIQAISTLAGRAKQRVIVIEAIKLLESSLADAVDTIWVVDATSDTQVRRLMDKRHMSVDEALKRISAQRSQADKLAKANVVIHNDGSVDDTWRQVQEAWKGVRKTLAVSTDELQGVVPTATVSPPTTPSIPAPQPSAPPAAPVTQTPAPTIRPIPSMSQPAAPSASQTVQQVPAAVPPAPPSDVVVRRGMPANAEMIANFMSNTGGKPTSRMDVMMSFGQKSYLLAQDKADKILALIGWQVENLITRVDEFYISPDAPVEPVIGGLVTAVEAASRDLQSEVNFVFLPSSATGNMVDSFVTNGYEVVTPSQIKIPAWREAVSEIWSDSQKLLTKKLRADRVLKPI
jgi:dephospho-CoA kinase